MLEKRRRDAGDKTLARLEDTVARLVCFTVLTRTHRARAVVVAYGTGLVAREYTATAPWMRS